MAAEAPTRPDALAGGSGKGPWGPAPAFRAPSAQEAAAVAAVYRQVDGVLAEAAQACRACGRCCTFGDGGIVLFASAVEMAYLLTTAGPPLVAQAPAEPGTWRCPYQSGARCTARRGRPLGCRTYFCDGAARRLGETAHAEAQKALRRAAAHSGRPWWYGPAQVYLAGQGAGGFPVDSGPGGA